MIGCAGSGFSAAEKSSHHSILADCEQCSTAKGEHLAIPDPWPQFKTEVSPARQQERLAASLFLSSSTTVSQHANILREHTSLYFGELNSQLDHGAALSVPIRACSLAAIWGCGQRQAFDDLMREPGFVDIHVLQRCLSILDTPRQIKQGNRKMIIASLQQCHHKGHLSGSVLSAARSCNGLGAGAACFAGQAPSGSSRDGTSFKGQTLNAPFHPREPINVADLKRAANAGPASLTATLKLLDVDHDPVAKMDPPSTTYTALSRNHSNLMLDMCTTHQLHGVTNALCKRVRAWFHSLTAESLEYLLLTCEPEALKAWRYVMDLCHAKSTDFALPFFPAVAFRGRQHVPSDHMVHMCYGDKLNAHTLEGLCQQFPRLANAYALVHKAVPPSQMSVASKSWFATHAPLSDVLWWYEELHCPQAEAALMQRLAQPGADLNEGQYDISFGKLMERFMVFRSMGASFAPLLATRAEAALSSLVKHHPKTGLRVAILGDASGSMEVAVRTASILGGLLSSVMDARLDFFDAGLRPQGLQPKTAAEVLDVATGTPASGSTNPAAALQTFLDSGEAIDLFVVVTDEGENGTSRGSSFAQLMKQYKRTVHAGVQVFFISFLAPNITMGPMQVALAQLGIGCHSFKLDAKRPDLSKFSGLLGKLNSLAKDMRLSWGSSAPAVVASVSSTAPDGAATKQHPAHAAAAPPPAPEHTEEVCSDTFGAATLRRGGYAIGAPLSARPGHSAAPAPVQPGVPAAGASGGAGGAPADTHDDDVGLQPADAPVGDEEGGDPCGAPEGGGGNGLGEQDGLPSEATPDVNALLARMAALEAENKRLKASKA